MSKVVLVVEDDANIREVIRQTLEWEGYEVNYARDGLEALTSLACWPPDLLILDLSLPKIDGKGVIAGLQSVYDHEIPFILVSADTNVHDIARRYGATGYVRKPFDLADLLRVVERVMSRWERA